MKFIQRIKRFLEVYEEMEGTEILDHFDNEHQIKHYWYTLSVAERKKIVKCYVYYVMRYNIEEYKNEKQINKKTNELIRIYC